MGGRTRGDNREQYALTLLGAALRRWRQRLWWRVLAVSMRGKVLGMVLVTVLVLGVSMTVAVQAQLATALERSLEERGVALARGLAEDAVDLLLTQNIFGVYQQLRTTLETNPDVRYVFVLDPQGRVVAHTFPNRVPIDLLAVNRLTRPVPWQTQILNSEEGLITDVAVPILDGRLGIVRLGMSHTRVEAAVDAATRRLIGITLLGLVLGGLGMFLLTHILVQPISALVEATRAVGRGDLNRRVPVRMPDEIGELTKAFNAMTADLAASREALMRQYRRVSALNEVAQAISGATSLDEMLHRVLETGAAVLGCEAAWIVLFAEEKSALPGLTAAYGLSAGFLAHELQADQEPCRCFSLIGAEDGWEDPIVREACPRLQRALQRSEPEARFSRHLSVPLIAHGRPLGTLNLALRADQRLSPEQIELAGAIGRQVGVAVEAERQRQRALEELAHREALRRQLLERVLAAQEEERRRIARELHDEAGQALTSLTVGFRLAEQHAHDPEALAAHLSELKTIIGHLQENLHRLAVDLHPAALDHLGLVAALRQHVETCARQHNLDIEFETIGLEEGVRLPPAVEIALYRIVQEALTNAMRHAGASHISVVLERRDDAVVALVEDDGVGFDPDRLRNGHLGLFDMRERAEMVGGSLIVESAPGQGTTVVVEVPYAHSPAYR